MPENPESSPQPPIAENTPERPESVFPLHTQAHRLMELAAAGQDYAITPEEFPDIPPAALAEHLGGALLVHRDRFRYLSDLATDPKLKAKLDRKAELLHEEAEKKLAEAVSDIEVEVTEAPDQLGPDEGNTTGQYL